MRDNTNFAFFNEYDHHITEDHSALDLKDCFYKSFITLIYDGKILLSYFGRLAIEMFSILTKYFNLAK